MYRATRPPHRPHREGCNSGIVVVQGLQRLQSGHSGKAHWRPTRLDTRLISARVCGSLTSGGQAEKRRCFPRRSPARETKGNAPDGAKRQRGHGHFMQTTTRREGEKRTMVEGGAQAQLFVHGKRAVNRSRRPRSHGSRSRRPEDPEDPARLTSPPSRAPSTPLNLSNKRCAKTQCSR